MKTRYFAALIGLLVIVSLVVRAQVTQWNGFPPPGMTYNSSSGLLTLTGTVNAQGVQINGAALTAPLTGTSVSIGGGALLAGTCTSNTVSITGATTSMVAVAHPNTYPGDGVVWLAYVSSSNTITVKVCAILALTPTASTYNVRVLP